MVAPTTQTNELSEYRWNGVAGRYIDASGKFVSPSAVRDELEKVIDAAGSNMNLLAQQLNAGQISIAEWQSGMMENIKIIHVSSGASAQGGWAQMSQSDWGFVGQRIRTQYDYLRNFANQVADGTQALDGRLLTRANMYADAGRSTFEEVRRRYERLNNGMQFERRVLGPADHCEDCLDYAAEGWQPIGTLPNIGESVCRTNCFCTFEYSDVNPDVEEGE